MTVCLTQLRLDWACSAAHHTDRVLTLFDLECDEFPEGLAEALRTSAFEQPLSVQLAEGMLVPRYDAAHCAPCPSREWQLPESPRPGRYYPGRLVAGGGGGVALFRCLDAATDHFTADFNHPLAPYPLGLRIKFEPLADAPSLRPAPLASRIPTGPGLQAHQPPRLTLSAFDYRRRDEAEDSEFYRVPRRVHHIDAWARARLAELHGRFIHAESRVLDLMSSRVTHLSEDARPAHLVGLGMNADELAENSLLHEYRVHDLNRAPELPYDSACLDVVLCALSIEYLIDPVTVLREVGRVLKPGGVCVISFSNRWFPPKAIALWGELHEFERIGLVLDWFVATGLFHRLQTESARGWPRPADDPYADRIQTADPCYAVWGARRAA